MRSRFTALSARSTPEPMPLSWTSKTLTYVNPSRSRSSRSSRLYDRTPMYTTCSTPTWSAIRRAEQACDHLSERYESRKSRWASIPITPMSFGNARTTAGARLCSPPMTIGIFPARTTSAAMCVTPSTISVDAPKVALVVHHVGLEVVRRLADRARSEAGAAAERARAVVRHSEQGHPRLIILRDGVREARRSHGRTEIACAYLRTTPLSWTRACVGRGLRRT